MFPLHCLFGFQGRECGYQSSAASCCSRALSVEDCKDWRSNFFFMILHAWWNKKYFFDILIKALLTPCAWQGAVSYLKKSQRGFHFMAIWCQINKMNNEMRLFFFSMIIIQTVFDFKATTSLIIVHCHLHALKIKVNNHQI